MKITTGTKATGTTLIKSQKCYALIIAALLAGCNSGAGGADIAPAVQAVPTIHKDKQPSLAGPTPEITQPTEKPDTSIPMTGLTPSTPVKPEPPKPQLPIFIGEGISTHTQRPYSGTVTRGGDDYLRYNSGIADFQDFELPEWKVQYKYEPFLEVLITDGIETLCARYSFKLKGFGYARPVCLWSDTRDAILLEDMKSAYYGYQVVESRVWVNGVVGLGVVASM